MDVKMELIDPATLRKVTEARKIIADLQVRLIAREQALDDLARAVEIAEITHQFHLVTSFRQNAEEQLQDRIIIPAAGENVDMKLRIYE
jgi:hypothetical protein